MRGTLTFPVYDGNGMFLSCGNLMVNPRVGMLFVNLESGTRLRLYGEASIDPDDPLVSTYPGAKMVVRVRAHNVFVNCRRYVHRYQLVQQSPFVPSPEGDAPVPDWKAAALVGASRPEQVAENVKASGIAIPAELMTRIDEVLGDAVERDPALVATMTPARRSI